MVQPTARIGDARAALDAARALQTPSEVRQFEAAADNSAVLRTFLATPEWAAIRQRIAGNGRPPAGKLRSLAELEQLLRWTADGTFSEEPLTQPERRAYLHAAEEVGGFARYSQRVSPVSPAPAPQQPTTAGTVAESMTRLSFGQALLACQAGRHIAREGWPAGGYVTAQSGYPQGIGVNANTAWATGLVEGTVVAFAPYLMRCSGAGQPSFVPWTPDQEDLFAQDWQILPRA